MTRRLLCLLPLLVVGCTSPDYVGDSLSAHRSSSADSSSSDDDEDLDTGESASTSKSSSSSKPASKGACSSKTTADACFECCSAKAPGAVDIYANALGTCLCQTPGACAQACASTVCAGAQPDAACTACIQSAKCEDPALTACEKDATCAPFLTCAVDSNCATK